MVKKLTLSLLALFGALIAAILIGAMLQDPRAAVSAWAATFATQLFFIWRRKKKDEATESTHEEKREAETGDQHTFLVVVGADGSGEKDYLTIPAIDKAQATKIAEVLVKHLGKDGAKVIDVIGPLHERDEPRNWEIIFEDGSAQTIRGMTFRDANDLASNLGITRGGFRSLSVLD